MASRCAGSIAQGGDQLAPVLARERKLPREPLPILRRRQRERIGCLVGEHR